MATPLTAAKMMSALTAEGLKVKAHSGWTTNNRNHKGAWGPVYGVVIHHTVSTQDDSSVELCFNGHATLPGPLCHAVGRNDGVIALVGHGRANHAGLGDDDVLKAVINETALPADGEANTDGNRSFYGLEIVNAGDNKDTYTAKQYRSAVLWASAICRAHGWSEKSVIGHSEWQPGKIDPRGPIAGGGSFTMTRFRADVKAQLHLGAGKPPVTTPKQPVVKPPAPTTPGVPVAVVPRFTQLSRQENLTIAAGAEAKVYFTAADVRDDPNEHGAGGYTILSTPAQYTGTVSVWPDTDQDAELGLIMKQELSDMTLTSSSTAEAEVFTGLAPVAVSVTGTLPAGRKLVAVLKNYGADALTIPRVDLRLISFAE
jgi:hypothetical protein